MLSACSHPPTVFVGSILCFYAEGRAEAYGNRTVCPTETTAFQNQNQALKQLYSCRQQSMHEFPDTSVPVVLFFIAIIVEPCIWQWYCTFACMHAQTAVYFNP